MKEEIWSESPSWIWIDAALIVSDLQSHHHWFISFGIAHVDGNFVSRTTVKQNGNVVSKADILRSLADIERE